MKTSPTDTFEARPRAIDPRHFRDCATGIGQTCMASAATGAARKARVVAGMPARQRAAVPEAEGYAQLAEPTPFTDFLDSEL